MNIDTKRFLYKLIPPRPTFVQDMTEAERRAMEEHAKYWKNLTETGVAVVFGLVLDPNGPWGVAIVEVEDEPHARLLGINDPAVKAGLTFEVYPMPKQPLS
jgi:uncharacterized protein YciI